MSILEQIKQTKSAEVDFLKKSKPIASLQDGEFFTRGCNLLSVNLTIRNTAGIIAEFKRQSPSKGIIRQDADPNEIIPDYERAGCAAVSVLTDKNYFGAQESDIYAARSQTSLPMLRKDFIIDAYQIYETKAMGADLVLLIAALLCPDEIQHLSGLARELGMDVLLELHDINEINSICDSVTLVGINNRNLKTFTVDVNQSILLRNRLPNHLPVIAESGIASREIIKSLLAAQFSGFLIGEAFMKAPSPGAACLEMVEIVNNYK